MTELKQEKFNETKMLEEIPMTKMLEYFTMPNEPHLACILLLDTSGSMKGKPIESLNKAINTFKEQVCKDELARQRVDVAIIEFNYTANVVQEFAPIFNMEPVSLSANGSTAMGAGINMAIDHVKKMNRFYASYGTPCFKPWIFMITDGEPKDDISEARLRIQEEERKNKLKFWAIGAPGYNKETLQSLTKRCISIDEANFEGIFNWLSESMVAISVSRIEENPQLGNLPDDAHVIPSDW